MHATYDVWLLALSLAVASVKGIGGPWLGGAIALLAVGVLAATLVISRVDARTAYLRGRNAALEAQVKRRTGELEGVLRQYEQTVLALEQAREMMGQEIEQRKTAQQRLEIEKEQQRRLIHELEETHLQLLQSEKLASIGQLAAGVAHEINNPISFVHANLNTLRSWVRQLLAVIVAQEAVTGAPAASMLAPVSAMAGELDLDYVRNDIMMLIEESLEGAMRVRQIVRDLRDFSRPSGDEWVLADLHAGLESTLNVVHNEIKYKAEVVRDYGELPLVECNAAQLNQVFMNLLVNAAQAIRTQGSITIRSVCHGDSVSIGITDTGGGIPRNVLGRIFDPFFTTKPIGQGTGLGLSISHGIVEHHRGRIDVESSPGEGTTFIVTLPVRRGKSMSAG